MYSGGMERKLSIELDTTPYVQSVNLKFILSNMWGQGISFTAQSEFFEIVKPDLNQYIVSGSILSGKYWVKIIYYYAPENIDKILSMSLVIDSSLMVFQEEDEFPSKINEGYFLFHVSEFLQFLKKTLMSVKEVEVDSNFYLFGAKGACIFLDKVSGSSYSGKFQVNLGSGVCPNGLGIKTSVGKINPLEIYKRVLEILEDYLVFREEPESANKYWLKRNTYERSSW